MDYATQVSKLYRMGGERTYSQKNTRRLTNVVLLFVHRLRHWTNIITTLSKLVVFSVLLTPVYGSSVIGGYRDI